MSNLTNYDADAKAAALSAKLIATSDGSPLQLKLISDALSEALEAGLTVGLDALMDSKVRAKLIEHFAD